MNIISDELGYVPTSRRTQKRFNFVPTPYLRHFREIARAGIPVVALVRESAPNDNLSDQRSRVLDDLLRAKANLVAVVAWNGKGSLSDSLLERRRAAQIARDHDAVVVAESASRFLRPKDFKRGDMDARPTDLEWRLLREWMWGVTLCTIEPPDLQPSKERGAQIKRGFREKWAKPGRPTKEYPGYKKQRRERLIDVVLVGQLGSHG